MVVLLAEAGGSSLPTPRTSSDWVKRVWTLCSDSPGEDLGMLGLYHCKSLSPDSEREAAGGKEREKLLLSTAQQLGERTSAQREIQRGSARSGAAR